MPEYEAANKTLQQVNASAKERVRGYEAQREELLFYIQPSRKSYLEENSCKAYSGTMRIREI